MAAATQAREARKFEVVEGVRRASRLLIGLVGPSSSGKTFSGLRLSTAAGQIRGGTRIPANAATRMPPRICWN